MTLRGIYASFWLASFSLPWLLNGVWDANSLAECREKLNGATGACFAVIAERWNQLLFGFNYPTTEYWRPLVAFILLMVAVAPVLFSKLPRQMLILTGLYPFIGFWLIWGGTILAPLVALVGFVVAGGFFQIFGRSNFALGFFGAIVIALIVWTLGSFLIPEGASDNALLLAVPSRDLGGFMLHQSRKQR